MPINFDAKDFRSKQTKITGKYKLASKHIDALNLPEADAAVINDLLQTNLNQELAELINGKPEVQS